ncbi:MAG: hypothetical protein BGN88_09750 [Clostridiales bacterium 43-6]|nr:MAG: hypothetical protein BGN88_09750 [Clostridiales bacterium 43-6]
MISYKTDSECCGCTACLHVCPKSAISMKESSEGFLMPEIDELLCIDCGRCQKVCEFKIDNKKTNNQTVFAVKKKEQRMESQSGGVFSAIAENFLDLGAVVYGVAMNNFDAVYTRITNTDELKNLKGSKYVQVIVGDIYLDVEKDLGKNKTVLFGGTPCHVDGLLHYLKHKEVETSLLFTYDLVCHGVPSPRLFKEYIELTEFEYNSKVSDFNFRDKILKWHGTTMIVNDEKVISENYARMYLSDLCLRNSCYNCKYAATNRISDITLGDFWGIEKFYPKFDDNKGCSLVIINTEKGKKIFEDIKSSIEYIESSLEECKQPNLMHSSNKPDNRDDFWKDYYEHGFKFSISKYCDYNVNKDYVYSSKI